MSEATYAKGLARLMVRDAKAGIKPEIVAQVMLRHIKWYVGRTV